MKRVCELLGIDHIGLINESLENLRKRLNHEICRDRECISYSECDKIHCHQDYIYENGIPIKKRD